ncbi:putative ribosomal protein L18 [Dioscorea sansibarensis]
MMRKLKGVVEYVLDMHWIDAGVCGSVCRVLMFNKARANTRTERAKFRNRRTLKKTRLLVFCSGKQLYAMRVDDQNKKTLFHASKHSAEIHLPRPFLQHHSEYHVLILSIIIV